MSLFEDHQAAHPQRPFTFTPYVDLLLVLLVGAGIAAAEAERQYTMAATRPALPDPQSRRGEILDLGIVVTRDGHYQLEESGTKSLSELEIILREKRRSYQDLLVLLDGDALCPYGAVVLLEDLCDRLEITHRRLVNRREEPEGATQ
jgi:biopolymer transport protein ExbD